jgi:hypothetical protein
MAKDRYDDTNRGALFKNPKKGAGDQRPDYAGSIDADGKPMWISGWITKSKAGETYMSLALKPKDADDKSGSTNAADA